MRRYNRLKRIIARAAFHAAKLPIIVMSYFDHRAYMRLYIPLLRRYGLRLKGNPRYIATSVYFDDMDNITLSERVVISSNVRFLTHDYSVTTALLAIGARLPKDIASDRAIFVGRNVFIGLNSIIMPNARIEDNVVVGAGSVVRGVVPSGSVVLGNPATVVGSIEEYAEKCRKRIDSDALRVDA